MYKTAEKRLKLAKAIFVGPDDESDKAGNMLTMTMKLEQFSIECCKPKPK